MKFPGRWNWEELRHKLVLTPEEKRVIAFIVAAFLLGLGTKCYRDTNAQPPAQMEKSHPRSHKAHP